MTLVKNLRGYWFERPGYLSVEVARVTLALIYIYCNWWRYDMVSADVFYARSVNLSAYHPEGIVALFFPSSPPGEMVFNITWAVARWSPVFLLLGLFSKPALWICFFSNLFMRSLGESFALVWSHAFNVIFLCHLAFLFAPVGQFYSLDRLIRHRLNKKMVYRNGFWCVVLGQWAAVLMFFSAFYHKAITKPYFLSFPWASSDNLRNQTLYRYESVGDDLPAYIEPIINNPFYFKTLAALNLIFQACVIFSLFFIHQPKLRLLFGFCFVLEEIGLSFFFQLHDWQWFPLLVFFIDWDYFFPRAVSPFITTQPVKYKKTGLAFIYGFIGFYLLCCTNKIETLTGQSVFGLRAYPFSQFCMYSDVFANTPDNPSVIFECHYQVNHNSPASAFSRKIKRSNYGNYNLKDFNSLCHITTDLTHKIKKQVYMPFKDQVNQFGILNSITTFTRPPQKAHLCRKYMGYSFVRNKGCDYYVGLKQEKDSVKSIFFQGFVKPRFNLAYINRQLELKPIELGPGHRFKIPAEYQYAYLVKVSDQDHHQAFTFLVYAD